MKEKPSESRNIHQRILDVMADLDYIQKGEKKAIIGPQQYRFVSHDQVTAAIHPLLVKNGIMTLPSIIASKQDGNRTEITLQVKFINVDKPEDFVEVTYLGYGIDTGDKGPGKAVSYAFKYAILKTFVLETGDDPDNQQNVTHVPEKPKIEEKIDYPMLNKKKYDDYVAGKVEMLQCTKENFIEYIDVVGKLKEWDNSRTIYEFEKDPTGMSIKFQNWVKSKDRTKT